MDADTHNFCTMIRNRSEEHRLAMNCFHAHGVLSPAFSILRQELDSMIRVIYLLQMADLAERSRLIKSLCGEKNGKFQLQRGNSEISLIEKWLIFPNRYKVGRNLSIVLGVLLFTFRISTIIMCRTLFND